MCLASSVRLVYFLLQNIQYFIFAFLYYSTLKDIVWLVIKRLLNLMVKLNHIENNDGNA